MNRIENFYDEYWAWRTDSYDYHKLGIIPIRQQIAKRFILEATQNRSNDQALRILDIGCGEGILGKLLSEESGFVEKPYVLGVDISSQAVEMAAQFYDETIVLDIETCFQDIHIDSFDFVVCLEVIEHIFYPDRLLKQCKNILTDSGRLIVSTPNFAHYRNRLTVLNGAFPDEVHVFNAAEHIYYFTFHSFSELLLKMGFELVRYDGTFEVPKLIRRALRQKLSKKLFFTQPNLWGKQIVYLAAKSQR